MKRVRWIPCVAVLSLGLVAPLDAHHSLAVYDQTTLIRIKGVITKVEWTNPHVCITLAVKNADGSTMVQRIELAPPGGLAKRGFDRTLLSIGNSVSFETSKAKNPQTRFDLSPSGRTLTLDDGRRFEVGDMVGWAPIVSRPGP